MFRKLLSAISLSKLRSLEKKWLLEILGNAGEKFQITFLTLTVPGDYRPPFDEVIPTLTKNTKIVYDCST